ncbi:MAG TPA: twin-arginine translocase TatA/TatE family subunit [Archaeoglobaceae archaeon]|nr:twin-arginine translocase TatA/TatE family subunit [Archaeoglobaceae archaeon]
MFPGGFGPNELILILVIAFLLFGASKLPQLARSVGKGMGEFKKAQKEAEIELREFENEIREGRYKGSKRDNIERLAKDLGIETEDKSEDEILEEIERTLPKSR